MKTIGIYKITSPSNKVYIGQSISIESRRASYQRGSGYKYQTRLKNSILKYGFENHYFEIIEECDITELNNKERYWQDHYNVLGNKGLNCMLTETNSEHRKVSEETKVKMSISRLKNNNPMFGKNHSDKTKYKISAALKGLLAGENHPSYGTKHNRNKKGVEAANYGMLHSKEAKLKMSKVQTGKIVSDKGKQNISRAKLGANNPNSMVVLDIAYGVFYTSVKDAAKYSNYTYDYLQRMLRGEYKNKTSLVYC